MGQFNEELPSVQITNVPLSQLTPNLHDKQNYRSKEMCVSLILKEQMCLFVKVCFENLAQNDVMLEKKKIFLHH